MSYSLNRKLSTSFNKIRLEVNKQKTEPNLIYLHKEGKTNHYRIKNTSETTTKQFTEPLTNASWGYREKEMMVFTLK